VIIFVIDAFLAAAETYAVDLTHRGRSQRPQRGRIKSPLAGQAWGGVDSLASPQAISPQESIPATWPLSKAKVICRHASSIKVDTRGDHAR